MMNTFLYTKFENNLKQHLDLKHGSSILLAISGGQDSLCLFTFFLKLKSKYCFNLGIIHIDHQWRNDSVYNTRHIINLAKTLNISTYIYQLHPILYSELEARNLRYQLLLDTAKLHKYSIIATAHTKDDQIETCLYNLMRGSTLDGFNSLVAKRYINHELIIIRPLLNFMRSELTWICRSLYLPIWSDITNFSYTKSRNRIRQELIPYIQYHLQNQIDHNLTIFIEQASTDSEYIRQNAIKIYQNIRHPRFAAINYNILLHQHKSLQKRVIYLFFLHHANISLPYHISKQILSQIYTHSKIDFFYSRIRIQNNYTWLYFS